MQGKLSSKSTFKPQLEPVETRDLPSTAGIALYMDVQTMQQGVQVMQIQANAANTDFANFGRDLQISPLVPTLAQIADVSKLGGRIEAVRLLDVQFKAELQGFQQAVLLAASDGEQSDQTIALISFLEVNFGLGALGGFLGGLFAGDSNNGGLVSEAQNALDQVNKIATSTTVPLPDGGRFPLTQTIDQVLNS